MDENTPAGYIPGKCNLGPAEIRRRMRIGYTGLGLAVFVFLLLEFFDLPRPYRVAVFPPLFYSLSGFIQARHRFCYVYGWAGIFSTNGRRQFEKVKATENARKDRRTALKIVVMTFLGSGLLTAAYMVA